MKMIVATTPLQRSFSLQQTEIITESHKQTQYRNQVIIVNLVLLDASTFTVPFSVTQGASVTRGKKDYKSCNKRKSAVKQIA